MFSKFASLWALFQWYFRPLYKWFLHRTTQLCELQRICYGEKAGASRCIGVENSLELSRSPEIHHLINTLNHLAKMGSFTGSASTLQFSVNTVLKVKGINAKIHPQFPYSFSKCLKHIWGYRQLIHDVEKLRTATYNTDNPEHEDKLLKLWATLMPTIPLTSRVTKQWQDIGFQGDDPKTDFRGMGLLGLDNLLFFASEYSSAANHVLAHSHHPTLGYDFAIVGINLTSMAYVLLKDGSARSHVYNVVNVSPPILIFHKLYSYLFYEFDKFWIEAKPKNVMDFSLIRDKFERSIRLALANPATVFRIVSIDNI